MVLTIKLDVKSAIIYFTFACIALMALALAYPKLRVFLPIDSSGLASWVQAAGSLLAIAATWYIASTEQRVRRESDYRLAALDASTMHAELSGSLISIGIARSEITRVYMSRDYSKIPSISERLKDIRIRPLSEQKDLALVGITYFSEITAVMRQLSVLNNNIDMLHFLKKMDPGALHFGVQVALTDAEKTEALFAKVTETLKVFAANQGVTLDDFH